MQRIIIILLILGSYQYSLSSDVKKDIEYLASEELEGRQPGTEGIEKAAQYIEKQFEKIGLDKVGDSYRQKFNIKLGRELGENNSIGFDVVIPRPGVPKNKLRALKRTWETGKDWMPSTVSANGEVSGDVVFVGYGISAEKLNYDDYADVDVTGKLVVCLTASPDGSDRSGSFSKYATRNYKASNAKKHGAAGIMFVKIQGDSVDVFNKLNEGSRINSNSGIVAIQAARTSIDKLFPRKTQLYYLENKINESLQPQSFLVPNISISAKVELTDIEKETSNIMGFLEGDSDEIVVIGAHYDHLGYGKGGSSRYRGKEKKIHYGADDNASGTAAVIEIARILEENPINASILFVAWSAEEMGLLGSKYFTENPNIDASKITAYYNYDMVGRLEEKITILGAGTSPNWKDILTEAKGDMEYELEFVDAGNGPSDHSSFYQLDKPVLAFFSGIHSDYHTPNDSPDKINYEGINDIINYSLKVIRTADEMNEIAFSKVAEPDIRKKMGRTKSNVTFGVIPSYSSNRHGFVIDDIIIGGPAHNGGMQAGDIIIEIDGEKIANIYDFMFAYWDKEPGDILNVKVLRGGKDYPIAIKVKLNAK